MASKKGDRYKCDECGLVIAVENPCGGCECEPCEVVCCGEPMKPVEETQKPKPKASPKPSPKASK